MRNFTKLEMIASDLKYLTHLVSHKEDNKPQENEILAMLPLKSMEEMTLFQEKLNEEMTFVEVVSMIITSLDFIECLLMNKEFRSFDGNKYFEARNICLFSFKAKTCFRSNIL